MMYAIRNHREIIKNMAQNPSVFVPTDEKPNLVNPEALATGAAAGAFFGSVLPFVGTVTGAAVGAVVNSVVTFGKQQANTVEVQGKQTTFKEFKDPSIFNREAILTAGAAVLFATLAAPVVASAGFLFPIGAIAATFIAGKFGEGRMTDEFAAAKQQHGLAQLQTVRSMQATNKIGGMNTVSSEEYARLQEAQQNRGNHGKFTNATLQREQQQQMVLASATR
jgi:hypothetical protein